MRYTAKAGLTERKRSAHHASLHARPAHKRTTASARKRSGITRLYKIPLLLSPQPEGGYTVTSPLLPELISEGDTAGAAIENVMDALDAVIELYEDQGKVFPVNARQETRHAPIWFEYLVAGR